MERAPADTNLKDKIADSSQSIVHSGIFRSKSIPNTFKAIHICSGHYITQHLVNYALPIAFIQQLRILFTSSKCIFANLYIVDGKEKRNTLYFAV